MTRLEHVASPLAEGRVERPDGPGPTLRWPTVK